MTEVRTYERSDAAPLVRLWNESMPVDPVSPDWFTDYVLLDPNFDPAGLLIATEGAEIVGCAYAVRRLTPAYGTELDPELGWIPFFFVAPSARGRGIGGRLLEDAKAFLRSQGRARVDFGCYTPNYFVPGIDERMYPAAYRLLLKAGFTVRYSPVAMDMSLVGYRIPVDIHKLRRSRESEGYRFAAPAAGELPELIGFAADRLAPDWGEAIRDAVLRGLPLDRILVARNQSGIVGFSMYAAYRGIRERFGPYGVDDTVRGTGIGKILLHLTLCAMHSEGLHNAWFLWTGEASPAGHLYRRTGFEVTRRFNVMGASL